MTLVLAAVAPHGFPLIPDLSDDAVGALATRAALQELGARADAAGIEALVIMGPHGFRVEGAVCLADVGRAAGRLAWEEREVELNLPVDPALTTAIAEAARAADIPVAMAGYGGNQREQGVLPMDWGTLVPAWFLGRGRNMPGHGDVLSPPPDPDSSRPIVIITPSRALPRDTLIRFGETLGAAVAADPRPIAVVASCDWAHTHAASGPYGFSPIAADVDARIVAALRSGDLLSLRDFPADDAAEAAIDGLWQTLVLGGVLEGTKYTPELLSYEAPTYYGMAVAAYTPAAGR